MVSVISIIHSPYHSILHCSVANSPANVRANRTAVDQVTVIWNAPPPRADSYEVFYQTAGAESRTFSGGNTSNTELILTGLTLGETYSIFVVAFGAENTHVLPSPHSSTAMITLSTLIQYWYNLSFSIL